MLPIIGEFPWRVIEAYPRTHALEMELMAFPNHTLHAHMPQFGDVSTNRDDNNVVKTRFKNFNKNSITIR